MDFVTLDRRMRVGTMVLVELAMDMLGVEWFMARNQETWETEYNNLVKELSAFVNKELNEFWSSSVSMGDSIRNFCIYNTYVHEST